MSKHETPLTHRYWESIGGTLVEEFPAVLRGHGRGGRKLDGLIVQDGHRRIAHAREVLVKGADIVVVQTKASRLGMYLLGQALFSAELMKLFSPRSIKTVAVCTIGDSVLEPLAHKYGIEVVVYGA